MMTFSNLLFSGIGPAQTTADAAAPAESDESADSTEGEFAAMLAAMWFVPVTPAIPKEIVNTGDGEVAAEAETVATETVAVTETAQPEILKPEIFKPGATEPLAPTPDQTDAFQTDPIQTDDAGVTINTILNRLAPEELNAGMPDYSLNKALRHVRLPDTFNDRPRPVGSALAIAFDAGALVSTKTELTADDITSFRRLIDKNEFFHFPVEHAEQADGEPVKAAKTSLFESVFHEAVRESIATVKADAPLSPTHSLAAGEDNQLDLSNPTDSRSHSLITGGAAGAENHEGSSSGPVSAAISRQVVNPIIEMAKLIATRETRVLRIQLHPDKFGQIDVRITRNSDGRLSADLVADSAAARHALAEGINHLRDSLEQSGLAVEHIEVRLASSSQGEAGNHSSQQGDSRPSHSGDVAQFSLEPQAAEDPVTGREDRPRLLNLQI
jgi:flagellar hook-length control protein FliK